jgi:VIT1/CCC1 family predicted Fe2+/Mn2+ transporter
MIEELPEDENIRTRIITRRRNIASIRVDMILDFIFFGFIQLLLYIVTKATNDQSNDGYLSIISIIMSGIMFFVIGKIKAFFTDIPVIFSVGETLLIGADAAAASYFIGCGLEKGIKG